MLCAFPTPRMPWQLLKTTKTQFSARISSRYYHLLWRVLLQQPLLPSLPLRCRLWDAALDKGVKGTRVMQAIFRELCRPTACFKCSLCNDDVPPCSTCLQHICVSHPSEAGSILREPDIGTILQNHISYKWHMDFQVIPSFSSLFLLCAYALWVTAMNYYTRPRVVDLAVF